MLGNLMHRCGLAASLVLALAPAFLGAAPAAPDTPDKDKDASPAAKLKKQLDQTLSLEVTEQSLNTAINQIREQTKINFVVDRMSIQQLGMDPEQILVSVKLKDVKTR